MCHWVWAFKPKTLRPKEERVEVCWRLAHKRKHVGSGVVGYAPSSTCQ
ncbi:unnamed protein product [Linum tenue]|uniref:Uncharacterized protein n=1 Tax=Linum tenue TaxID=586396 RepID=A0AAV0P6Q8_9ROSI|nr:unnamed protein product [Linum tenue]